MPAPIVRLPFRPPGARERVRCLMRLVALAGLACAQPAAATDYYACECRSGAEPGCSAGSDRASGTRPDAAWQTASRLQQAVAGSACGDTFNFCAGGVFDAPRRPEWTRASQDCSTNPRIVGSYDPGGFTRRPRIVARGSTFNLDQPGARGITIRGLDIVCSGACDAGVGTIFGNVDDVVLDDLLVDGFNVCIQWGPDRRMGVRGSTIQNCRNQGIIGPAGDGSYVTDSRFINNGCLDPTQSCSFSHAHYWNVRDPGASLVVRDNYYGGNTLDARQGGACNGNVLAIRGGTNVVVEGNTFDTPATPEPQAGCMVVRMATSQAFQKCTGCAFRRNRILGGHSLLEVESWIGGYIENNVLYAPVTSVAAAKTGISIQPSRARAVPSNGLTIRNNSIAMGSSGDDRISAAIDAHDHTAFGLGGTNLEIVGNAIQMRGSGAKDVCFRFFDERVVANLREDYNVCGRINPNASFASTLGAQTLEQWRSRHPGQGVHSVDADPAFAAPGPPTFDFGIGATSPARDAGDPARSAPADRDGKQRPVGAAPDAGAHEYGAPGAGSP